MGSPGHPHPWPPSSSKMLLCSRSRLPHVLVCLLVSFISSCLPTVHAQTISTSMPVPPLQWIELTGLLSGTSVPPPLKDASIGYDSTDGLLLIFGGESQQGFATQNTYALDLKSLQWSSPQAPNQLDTKPPSRSAMISGDDSAASYRHGHVIVDGESSSDTGLADIWEFDYTSKFWQQVGISPGGPSARWGAVGGIDVRTSNPGVSLNNSFYMAGGYDGKTISPLSEVWRMDISGTLSSNNPNQINASWTRVNINTDITGRVSMGGTIIGQQIVAVGGCTSATSTQAILDSSCAVQDTQIIDASSGDVKSIAPCIAARIDPAVVPNMNGASTDFNQQAFVLLGTFNSSLWDDGGGLARGEVDVLEIGTGAWARVLPAGDPNSGSKYPKPRQGAAVLSVPTTLVGDTSIAASDTIIFGGRDAAGNYLQDVWILRAYNASLSKTNATWSGFSGSLQSGINANGQGVTVQYLSQCATSLGSATSGSSKPGSTSTGTGTGTGSPSGSPSSGGGGLQSSPSNSFPFNTSMLHKALGAVSVALFLPAAAFYRISQPAVSTTRLTDRNLAFMYLGVVVGVAAYALGIVGLATSFTSITAVSPIAKRALTSLHLQTAHGKAGLALFACLYGLVPLLQLLALAMRRCVSPRDREQTDGRFRADSTLEKLSVNERAASPSARSEPASHPPDGIKEGKRRIRSWAGIGTWAGITGRRSNDTGTVADDQPYTPSQRSFEVVNRPIRQRRMSANSLAAFSDPRPSHRPRNLSDMSWLDPRRSTSGMGGEYGLSPIDRREAWTPGTTPMEINSTNGLMLGQQRPVGHPILPPPFEGFIHVLFHALLLALTIFSLVALWQRGLRAAFGVFLAWTAVFYIILIALAWNGRPRESVLSVIFSRLRAEPAAFSAVPRAGSPAGSRPLSTNESVAVPFPTEPGGRGPYQHHQPPYRTAGAEHDYRSTSHGHASPDVDDDDDDDEDTRQRRIEDELSRRDVSIVTVPKRRLYLLNPNPPEEEAS
ncbi:hypothetical protein BD311DRAFT_514755 [Dichomitus squalens]|uniref:Galactose oxidase n=1 Tax=Dichomitus squalens TaxID=114155 RepID=A0A4Q9N2G0_9APHY|nr:hypothetical protein BD311DRAFT_514755 [Dichomitus squalens]